jgi:hypothetical protein
MNDWKKSYAAIGPARTFAAALAVQINPHRKQLRPK